MSKKLILFLMVLLFGSTNFLRADELTVCDGTETNAYVPVYGLYTDAYLRCQYVMPAASLADMDGGTINSMRFALASPASGAWTGTFQVYMMEVAYTEIAAFEDVAGATTVYTGTLDGTGSEMTVSFTTPYEYNGGNLLVGFDCITTGNYKSASFYGITATGASVQGYSYTNLASVSPSQRNFLPKTTFVYEAGTPVPPTPTGELVITPETFALGYRPVNGWTEPLAVSIINGAEPATITAVISNTAGNNPFTMSQEINGITLEAGETIDFTIDINRNATVGEYAEEFTMFSVTNAKDITTVPVTATFYTAGPADIVETAENIALSYTSGVANFSKTPTDLHANYFGYNNVTALDAVYVLNITKDSKFTVNGGTFIGIYNKVSDFHPTAAIQPVLRSINGSITEEILLAGQYYMIVSGDNITTIEGTVEQYPAPGALTNLAPADQMTGVEAPVVLTWEGGENAAEYQVLFGTSPIYMLPVLDWTIVDDNYGSFDVSELIENNTQYFWKINARNSNGTVTGGTWGFTSTLTTPNTVTASEEEIFTDGTTLIRWKHSSGAMGNLDETQIGSGTSTSGYFPTYNLYNYSLTEQIYTSDELGGTAGYINSISFYPATGSIIRNLQIYVANTDKESFGGGSDWVAMTDDNLVYSGDVEMVANTWVTVTFDEPFAYEGGNIILAVNDLTGTWTSTVSYYVFDATAQAINVYQDSAPYSATAPSATGTVRTFKNQIIINKDGAKGATANRSFMYYNVYYGDVKANAEPIYEKQYLLGNLPYNVEPGHNVSVTAVYDEGESALSNPVVVKVSGYGTFTGTVTELISGEPVAGVTVKFNGKDEFNNNVSFEGTTNDNGVYTITAKAGTYVGVASLEGMEPNYSTSVTLAYDGTETVDFVIHEVYKPVLSVLATEVDPTLAKVQWSVNYAISGGGTSGAGDTFTEDFESGSLPTGWATIDADGDGYTWTLASTAMGTGYGHNGSSDMIFSQSYVNYVGALNPDNYLVTSQVTLSAGSTFSFWACAQDASYAAEHFGVAISTGSQTNASDFTTIQEWTMTAKGSGVMAPGRDGETRAQGNWYQYSVDLSSYAGQQVYIAIRHFNCSDWFYLDVDDVELSVSRNRDVDYYTVYRKAILKETELTPEDSVLLVNNVTDTNYADFGWATMEPGLYQYGVSAIYPSLDRGNRDEIVIGDPTSTTTNSYLPTNSYYNYSLTQQIYTADEIGMAGTINTLTMWLKNTSSYARNINVYMKESDITAFASGSAWVSMTDADMVGSFTLATGISSPVETAIALSTPFNYSGTGNLVICFQDVTGSWNSGAASVVMTANGNQAIYVYRDNTVYDPTTPGVTGTTINQKSVIKLDLTPSSGGGNDNPITPICWSNILPKDMETTVTVNATITTGSTEGATVTFTNTFENLVVEAELDETGTVTFNDFRKGEYTLTVALNGYISNYNGTEVSIWEDTEFAVTLTEDFIAVDELTVSGTGFARWTDILPEATDVAERYTVMLNNVTQGQTTNNYMQLDVTNLTVGQTYTAKVAVIYTTGMSAWTETTFTYIGCDAVATQVENLEGIANCMNVVLTWNGGTPTPPTPPTPPTGGWTEDFEGGLNGWTVLTVNADGGNWIHSSANLGGYNYTTLAHGGTGFAMCYSYVDYDGPYDTDSYLITPQMNSVSAGSTLTFWADNANDSYPENFSVCVATAANPTASDFTTVWSGGAKGTSKGEAVRHDGTRYQNWRQHTIDLSAYAGQNVWIAFHDVNYDMYEIWIDDVTFTTDAKSGASFASAGEGFGTAANTLTRDWYYYDNGVNADAIGTGGGNFWWGIMLPAGSYEGTSLTKVAAYDYMAMTGNVNIYQGGTTAPAGASLGQINVTFTGSNDFVEFTFDEPITLDPAQNVWVILYNGSSATYPAAVCANTGDANGRWVSLDGSSWGDLTSYGLSYTFMVRAYIEQGSGGSTATTITPNKFNIFMDGEVIGATSDSYFNIEATDTDEHFYEVYFVDANYNFSCAEGVTVAAGTMPAPANIVWEETTQDGEHGILFTWDAVEGAEGYKVAINGNVLGTTNEAEVFIYGFTPGDYTFGVAAFSEECESEFATVDVTYTNVEENEVVNAIYPNPTSGDLYINATAMKHISVVNAMGQMVYSQNVEGDETVINMAQFESGIYMVNVITENGSSVKRITVVK